MSEEDMASVAGLPAAGLQPATEGQSALDLVREIARFEHSGDEGFDWPEEEPFDARHTLDRMIAKARDINTAPLRAVLAEALAKSSEAPPNSPSEASASALPPDEQKSPLPEGLDLAELRHRAEVAEVAAALMAEQRDRLQARLAWTPINAWEPHNGGMLVCHRSQQDFYQTRSAFLDVTGVWRLLGSPGGELPLGFEPTHVMELPDMPEVDDD